MTNKINDISPTITVGKKQLVMNQTFLIEEGTEDLEVSIPFFNQDSGKNGIIKIRAVFYKEEGNIEVGKQVINVDEKGTLNFNVPVPTVLGRSISTVTPVKFTTGKNKEFSIYFETLKVSDSLSKMTVSIYMEDKI